MKALAIGLTFFISILSSTLAFGGESSIFFSALKKCEGPKVRIMLSEKSELADQKFGGLCPTCGGDSAAQVVEKNMSDLIVRFSSLKGKLEMLEFSKSLNKDELEKEIKDEMKSIILKAKACRETLSALDIDNIDLTDMEVQTPIHSRSKSIMHQQNELQRLKNILDEKSPDDEEYQMENFQE